MRVFEALTIPRWLHLRHPDRAHAQIPDSGLPCGAAAEHGVRTQRLCEQRVGYFHASRLSYQPGFDAVNGRSTRINSIVSAPENVLICRQVRVG